MDRFPRSSSTHNHLSHRSHPPSSVTSWRQREAAPSQPYWGLVCQTPYCSPPHSAQPLAAWEDKSMGGESGRFTGQRLSFYSPSPLCCSSTSFWNKPHWNQLLQELRGERRSLSDYSRYPSLLWLLQTQHWLQLNPPAVLELFWPQGSRRVPSVLHSSGAKDSHSCMNVQFQICQDELLIAFSIKENFTP